MKPPEIYYASIHKIAFNLILLFSFSAVMLYFGPIWIKVFGLIGILCPPCYIYTINKNGMFYISFSQKQLTWGDKSKTSSIEWSEMSSISHLDFSLYINLKCSKRIELDERWRYIDEDIIKKLTTILGVTVLLPHK